MKELKWLLIPVLAMPCWAASGHDDRQEAEYYVAAYAQHYRVPVEFVRALVEQESAWQRCAISSKGAAGLMQLIPETARKLGIQDRCDLQQNISGGVRHLAYLIAKFHGDLRLASQRLRVNVQRHLCAGEPLLLDSRTRRASPCRRARVELVVDKPVLMRRFDRDCARRIPFLSAMSILCARDNQAHS